MDKPVEADTEQPVSATGQGSENGQDNDSAAVVRNKQPQATAGDTANDDARSEAPVAPGRSSIDSASGSEASAGAQSDTNSTDAISPAAVETQPQQPPVDKNTLINGITADLKARRLARPDGNNALQKIDQLRQLDPTHDYSINGYRYVARLYTGIGRWRLQQGNRAAAKRALINAWEIDPKAQGATRLVSMLESAGETIPDKPALRKPAPLKTSLPPVKTGGGTDQTEQSPGDQSLDQQSSDKQPAGSSSPQVPLPPASSEKSKEDFFPVMVAIPAGRFAMGSEQGAEDEKPVRLIAVRAFSMSRYEVTVEQYLAYLRDTGQYAPAEVLQLTPNQPVTHISWDEAGGYVRWLSALTGKQYRLPSEAEWEYACRAGTTTARYHDSVNEIAWHDGNAGDASKPVGLKTPNAFGLHDMLGNVWEWVEDHWEDSYDGAPVDGSARLDADSDGRVLRGGSWSSNADWARSAARIRDRRNDWYLSFGFRLARTL